MKMVLIRGLGVFAVGVLVFALLAVAPLGGILGVSKISAEPAGDVVAQAATADSGIQIQNLSTTNAATVSLEFFPQGGGASIVISKPPIAAGGSTTVYLPSEGTIANGFMGSVVISSDQPVAAIAKTNWSDKASSAYTGFQAGNTSFYMPLILRTFHGQNSRVTAQNTGTASANVTLNIYVAGQTTPKFTETKAIGAGASYTWDQSAASFAASLGEAFIGSATVTSASPVAAVADVQVLSGTGGNNAVYTHNGFAAGATELKAPLVRKNFFGVSGIQVQNVGTTVTTVTCRFVGKVGVTTTNVDMSVAQDINPNTSFTFYTPSITNLPDQFLGAATISSSGNVPIVALVNDLVTSSNSSAAYNADTAANATKKIVVPLARNRHTSDQMTTGVQVINVGTAPANATITFTGSPSLSTAQATDTAVIPVGSSVTFYQGGKYLKDNNTTLPSNWLGSAVVTSDQNILAIVNDISLTNAWDAAIFNAINSQ